MPDPPDDEEFGAFRDYLMVLARSQVSVDLRGRIDPSDLVQETLCDALRDLPRYRGRSRAKMIGKLSPPQAEAIVLKHCQGMSVVDIGRHMNRTPDAVGGLLRHGMRRL